MALPVVIYLIVGIVLAWIGATNATTFKWDMTDIFIGVAIVFLWPIFFVIVFAARDKNGNQ